MFAVVGVPSLATIGELNFLNIDGEAADLERKYSQFFDKKNPIKFVNSEKAIKIWT